LDIAITSCFLFPVHQTSAFALRNKTRKHRVSILKLNCCHYCFVRYQTITAWFLQYCWLATHTHAAVWLHKFCSRRFSALGCWRKLLRKHILGKEQSTPYKWKDAFSVLPVSKAVQMYLLGELGKYSTFWLITFQEHFRQKLLNSDNVRSTYI